MSRKFLSPHREWWLETNPHPAYDRRGRARKIRRTVKRGPYDGARKESNVPHESASGDGNRASWHDGGCSVGKYAYSRVCPNGREKRPISRPPLAHDHVDKQVREHAAVFARGDRPTVRGQRCRVKLILVLLISRTGLGDTPTGGRIVEKLVVSTLNALLASRKGFSTESPAPADQEVHRVCITMCTT